MATTTTTTTTERLYASPSRSQLARQAAYQLLSPLQDQPSKYFESTKRPSKDDQHYPTTNSYLTSPIAALLFLPLLASVWFLANTSGPALWFAALVDFSRVAIVTGVICGLDWYARGVLSESTDKGGNTGDGEGGAGGDGQGGGRSESVVRTFVLVGFVVVLGEVMSLGGSGG